MKTLTLLFFVLFSSQAEILKVQVETSDCQNDMNGQLFVTPVVDTSKLIYQIEIPLNAKAALNLPKEEYKITFISKSGCEDVGVVNLSTTNKLKLNPRKKL